MSKPVGVGARMKSQAERQAEQRQARLDDVERDVQSGSLKIRKMTAEEREKYPPKQRPPKRRA